MFLLLVAFVGWRYELEIGLFFENLVLDDRPARHPATHLAAVPAGLGGLFMEKRAPTRKAQNLILLTLDGLRWQEVFGGADSVLISDPDFSGDTADLRRLFWDKTPDDRRRRLMPFFWEKLAPTGLVAGNRWLDSRCEVSNRHRVSYPGYAEMLCGQVDNRINSNRKVSNPHPNVFEFLNHEPGFAGRVAVFASWDVFPSIYCEKRSGLPISTAASDDEKPLPEPWPGVRDDRSTFRLALSFLKRNHPRALAIHLDGTDDSAHDGRYDDYLKYARLADSLLQNLWEQLQKDPFYRGKTALVLTTDHGRGEGNDWKRHNAAIAGSEQVWSAVFSPDLPGGGELRGPHPVIFQKQIAPTLAALVGRDFTADVDEAGESIWPLLASDQRAAGRPGADNFTISRSK